MFSKTAVVLVFGAAFVAVALAQEAKVVAMIAVDTTAVSKAIADGSKKINNQIYSCLSDTANTLWTTGGHVVIDDCADVTLTRLEKLQKDMDAKKVDLGLKVADVEASYTNLAQDAGEKMEACVRDREVELKLKGENAWNSAIKSATCINKILKA